MRHHRSAVLACIATILVLAACGNDPTVGSTSEPAVELSAAEPVANAAPNAAPVESDEPTVPSTEPATKSAAETTGEPTAPATTIDPELFPVVLGVNASTNDSMSWRFDVTLSSPYDTPERYADAWRVLDPNDVELGIRVLGHDHADEQPFTRSQSGIVIPEDATVVYVEGRDQANGWSGQRYAFELTR